MKLSYSSISTFQQCPYKFYRMYVKYDYKETSFAANRGDTIHKDIELFVTGLSNNRPKVEPADGLLDVLRNLYETSNGRAVSVEGKFAINNTGALVDYYSSDVILRGKVDVNFTPQNNVVTVIDWKSGQKRDYSLQGKTYATLMFAKYEYKLDGVKVIFDHLEKGRQDPQIVTLDDTKEVWELMNEIHQTQKFECKYNQYCKYCKMPGCRYAGI